MKFVSENLIDEVIVQTENPAFLETEWQKLSHENPFLLQFIAPERSELLTKEESELLEFLVLVIYIASRAALQKTPVVQAKILEENEEINWETWNETGEKSPKKAIDAFFENYFQEDLLAFVEDSLAGDNDDVEITNVGIEIIMVTTKAVIDTLHSLND